MNPIKKNLIRTTNKVWLDNGSQILVDKFWEWSGILEPFPRSLERPIAFALPIAIVKLPRLHLQQVEGWLRARGIIYEFGCSDRLVHGCLVAYCGKGMIFVDGTDQDDERRFTLAHEVAHFILDYLSPRQVAIERLGEAICFVLDGLRPPSIDERVQAWLSHCRLGVYTNLMEREGRVDDLTGTLDSLENNADRVALALLAPPARVMASIDPNMLSYDEREKDIIRKLVTNFGLPASIAHTYGRALLVHAGMGRSWLARIGLR
jgi:hypothetical protein